MYDFSLSRVKCHKTLIDLPSNVLKIRREMTIETYRLAFTANGKPDTSFGIEIKLVTVKCFTVDELLIRLKTPHRDTSFDHGHLLTDVNDFSAYMASRLNCDV